VELSRAVAVAEQQGPEAGLEIVDSLALDDYRYLHATRGELLRRLGRTAEAGDAYRRALGLVHDDAERRLLESRLAELHGGQAPHRGGRSTVVPGGRADARPPGTGTRAASADGSPDAASGCGAP
jgi:RNA polymerase sigma-70 factor (ECF subfamily)